MSVDFSPYINLRIYDKDASELYLSALELLRLNVPQLVVRPGTIEDGLVQAFAYTTTVAVNHINALPNRLVEGLASFMGVSRRPGTYASVTGTFTALDYAGGTLEAGTTVEHKYQIAGETYRDYYELLTALTIEAVEEDPEADPPTPLPNATATLVCVEQGEKKSIAELTELTVINSQSIVDVAIAGDDYVQGSFEETDTEYLARVGTYLRSLSSTISTAKQLESYALSTYDYVGRAKAYDLTDSETNRAIDAADAPGYISLFVYGKDSPISVAQRSTIYANVFNKVLAGLQVVVEDFQVAAVEVTATVKIINTANIYSTENAIRRQLTSYLSPALFSLDGTPAIRKSQLLAQISSIPGVSYVESLSFTCEDSTASGDDLVFDNKGVLPELLDDDFNLTVEYV